MHISLISIAIASQLTDILRQKLCDPLRDPLRSSALKKTYYTDANGFDITDYSD